MIERLADESIEAGQMTDVDTRQLAYEIESLGLTRRFDYDRDKDKYTSHAYA